MQTLTSYVGGRWVTGEGPWTDLTDPTTEEVIARASTGGVDFGAAVRHARAAGPALRALTFAERGALLEKAAKAIHAVREELLDLAIANGGNTRSDAKFDVDGATGTLMHYAELGRALGGRRVLLEGEPSNIGRSGRLQGQHVLAPRHGVAIAINAFNFPCWGLAEKAACAWLAGVPVIGKPATATALVTWRMVQAVVEAGALPEGALGLISGGVGDLFDHLTWRDVVAFTGSADTARRIRGHARILENGVAVNVEADSLNAAVLAPGAEDATYDAFIRDAHKEITQKAGQKCTATRRIFVPRDRLDDVIADLGERLGTTIVGDPRRDEVGMGPLATKEQLRSAREGVEALGGEARVVWGQPAAKQDRGYFFGPLLLRADDPHGATRVHELEVFGPVSTLMPYDGTAADAASLVQRGDGSLVASIYGDDREFLAAAIVEMAGWHGRLVVTDEKIADKAIAPGTVLPNLLHGGPGRAGGGTELGGLIGLGPYVQRCAVQGNGPLIAKLLGA